jgi:hypothetical protein
MSLAFEIDYSKFTPDEVERLRTAAFGVEVEHFKDSLIGRFLLSRAQAERSAALELLAEVDPVDAERIRYLQSAVQRCDSFGSWLDEALIAGRNAELELQEMGA